jgi:hypothetical protein
LGVSLTEQGFTDSDGRVPARLCDWLLAIEGVENEVQADAQRRAEREAERGR